MERAVLIGLITPEVTQEQAYEYYIENVWGTDKDVVVNKCYLDESDDTLKVEQMKKGSA